MKQYLIGEASELTGLSRDTLRFYEKKGLIRSERKENGSGYILKRSFPHS